MKTDPMQDVAQAISKEIMAETFQHLHTHPETSWQEEKTSIYIKGQLEKLNFRVRTFVDCPGVIAEWGKGSPVIGLRADMDALFQEVQGKECANHSCGHDAHMTMVLGVARLLNQLKPNIKGTVRLIFQPAEERGEGALKMVEKGVADDLDYLYGVHLRPQKELENGKASASIRHGAAAFLIGEIDGEDAHGARPYLGVSAITVGMDLAQHINGIRLSTFQPYSIKMTHFNTIGQNPNIIAGKANFSLDLRAQTNAVMGELIKKATRVASKLESFHGAKIKLKKNAAIAAAEVDEEAEHLMSEAITDVLGKRKMLMHLVTSGGDDFHFYTKERPHIKATMLGLGCGLEPGLHHPDMHFDHEAMVTGIHILYRVIIKTSKTVSQEARDDGVNHKKIDYH